MLYIFIFVLFVGKNTQKAYPRIILLYSAEGGLKYVSQSAHLCSRNTKKGDSPSFYIYLYKTYGILFLHGSVFVSNLQWVSNKEKNNSTRQILPTKSHH